MAVNDMRLLRVQAKLLQNPVHHLFLVKERIIVIFGFLPCFLIFHKIALKGGHFILAEHRRIRAGPDIPDIILCPSHSRRVILGIVPLSGIIIQNVVQLPSPVLFAVNIHRLEISVLVQRHAAMIKQIGIMNLIQSPVGVKETHVPLQLFTL